MIAAEEKARVEAEKRVKEQAERDRIAAEQKIKQEAEAKQKAAEIEKAEAEAQLALRPDKEKLLEFAEMLEKLEMPKVVAIKAVLIITRTQELIDDVVTHIRKNLK